MKRYAIVGVVLLALCAARPARSDDPVSSAVRFNREVVRIFDRKCLPCHAPGAIAMSLATYREARPWARAIREELVEQRMPPWSAARGSARFSGDIGLTPRELTTILTWVDGGTPRGEDGDLPTLADAAVESADVALDLPSQAIPGTGADIVRRVTIAVPLPADRWVRQVRVRPGERRLLRAAFATIAAPPGAGADGGRVWVAAWTPWQPAIAPPPDAPFLVRAHSHVTVELHYRATDAPAVDRSAVELIFADGAGPARSGTVIVAAAPAGAGRRAGGRTLVAGATVWGIRATGLAEGQTFEVTAQAPDGGVQVLLWVPRYRAEWPAPFILAQPLRLAPGTRLRVVAGGGGAAAAAVLAIAK
jgi:hypothetical protein